MSNAALKIPGCACCLKTGVCICGDLDLAKGIGLRADVPDVTPDDVSDRLLSRYPPFYWTRNYWWKQGYYGQSPTVDLGGDPGCKYGLEFTIDYRIDRGTYSPGCSGSCNLYSDVYRRDWPAFYLLIPTLPAPIPAPLIGKSTGEGMFMGFEWFLEVNGTAKVITIPAAHGPTGPVKITLAWQCFRFSATCFAVIKNITCLGTV